MLETGQQAPPFTLPDQSGTDRDLSDYRGRWVVLYFYPRDDTPGCTTEACEFTAAIEEFRDLEAVVLGCSPDPPESHQAFAAKHDLDLVLLSDEDHEVLSAYGAWGKKKMYGREFDGVIRSTFLVDPEGRIAHRWQRVRAKGHAERVRDRLRELAGARSG